MHDTSVVELHRLLRSPAEVSSVEGAAFRVTEEGSELGRIEAGHAVAVGDTLALAPNAVVTVDHLVLSGGKRGRAISLVAESAFRSSPSKKDVPKLLAQLEEIDRQMLAQLGEDPLRMHRGPESAYERAASAEFAQLNLVLKDARELPQERAEELRAVCLFFSDEAAFVAFSSVTIARLRALMELLNRPVNPHLVEDQVLDALLSRVYTPSN